MGGERGVSKKKEGKGGRKRNNKKGKRWGRKEQRSQSGQAEKRG